MSKTVQLLRGYISTLYQYRKKYVIDDNYI